MLARTCHVLCAEERYHCVSLCAFTWVWVTSNKAHHLESGFLRRAELKTFIDEDGEVALAYVSGHFRSKLSGNHWPLHRRALNEEREEKQTEISRYKRQHFVQL